MQKKYIRLFYFFIFIVFGLIGYWMPLVGDDLNWWSSWGTHYFTNGTFLTYDGRYLGDLLIILMTRSKVVTFIIYGSCALGLTALMTSISQNVFIKHKTFLTTIIAAISLLFLPKTIFQQIWGWHAGLANYVPSVLFPLFFLYLISKFYDNFTNEHKTNQWFAFFLFIIAILSQFLAEHITIINCLNDILILIFWRSHFNSNFWQKYFKWICLGNFIGAFLMFINGAYLKVLFGHDNYRSLHQNNDLFIFLKTFLTSPKVLALLVMIIIILLVNRHFYNNSKLNTINLLLLIDTVFAILPFIVISPFGARCIFASYVFLLTILIVNITPWIKVISKYLTPLALVILLLLSFKFDHKAFIYNQAATLSQKYCIYQQGFAQKERYVLNYPDNDYLWAPNMSEDGVYLSYYVMDKNKKIIPVDYQRWNKFSNHFKVTNFPQFDSQIRNSRNK